MDSKPRSLTAPQFEILEMLWAIGPPGGTTAEVWELISEKRSVGRTTVLKAMERLENYGWLERKHVDGAVRYWPTASREEIEQRVMTEVMEGFFNGSPKDLVKSLLGAGTLTKRDAQELRRLLEDSTKRPKRRRQK